MHTDEYIYESWRPVSGLCLWSGIIGFVLFIIHAAVDKNGFLILDYVNLPFHEFGHIFFGIFGDTAGVWGGTVMQILIPGIVLLSFWFKRDLPGTAFSVFWIGENLLNISVYIRDARRMELPLVGGGLHDWNKILSSLGLLEYDDTIAWVVRLSGWSIMISSVIWFLIFGLKNRA